ncbi:hypothetical protein [Rhodoplanes sp. Z2-YC6860]|uniref:hypothetical protein n=1 Tax=Rhodoplanes sp. Z2-YC6860 TaxID=674703 RepID=UPI00082F4573|nr:hypothetical protein [Rhodoplanes sp. Z2-YC6860]
MPSTLTECERDVEQARAKLAQDLATLRSPETFSSFTDDLKQEAFETKDAIVEKARSTAESVVTGIVNEIKAKAAENPAAVLAIAAGIGWRLIRNPPIATALVGVGLYSLWKTESDTQPATDEELVERGKQRLKQQLSTAAAGAKDIASGMGQAAAVKANEVADAARQKIEAVTDQGRMAVHDARDAIAQNVDQMVDRVRTAGNGARDAAAGQTAHMADRFGEAASQARAGIDRAMDQARERTDQFVAAGADAASRATQALPARDQVLLGVAGLAVAAALGIACQRRVLEDA